MPMSTSEPYNPAKQAQWSKPSLYPSTQELAQSLESLQLPQRTDEKPSISESYYRQTQMQQNGPQNFAPSKQDSTWPGNVQSSVANEVPGRTAQYQQPNYNGPYSDYQQSRTMPLSSAGASNMGSGSVMSSAGQPSQMPGQVPQMMPQHTPNPQANTYPMQYGQQVPMSVPNHMTQQHMYAQQQPSQPVGQPQFSQQSSTTAPQQFPPPQVIPTGVHFGQPRSMVPPQQMMSSRPIVAPGMQQAPTQQVPSQPTSAVPSHLASSVTSPQVAISYQQPNAQQIQNPLVTGQPPPNQPWAPSQGPHGPYMGNVYPTQPPGSNYLGNQPSAEVKPPSQDINQPTKPVNQGSYGYPQQPNMFPGQVQNYQPQVVGQPGVPVPQGSGMFPKPTGQPEQYNGVTHGYRQPQSGAVPTPNQSVQGRGSQQPPVSGNTIYSPQPSFPGQMTNQGAPYNQSPNWTPTQPLYTQTYQGAPQSYPNPYTNTASLPPGSYPNPYSTNTTPYTLHGRNVGNEYGTSNQPVQMLQPLPNFPLKGAPSDMHIKNINRILQLTSNLLPQVEQFKGKRGSVLPTVLHLSQGNMERCCPVWPLTPLSQTLSVQQCLYQERTGFPSKLI